MWNSIPSGVLALHIDRPAAIRIVTGFLGKLQLDHRPTVTEEGRIV